jgi:hypothetical protein
LPNNSVERVAEPAGGDSTDGPALVPAAGVIARLAGRGALEAALSTVAPGGAAAIWALVVAVLVTAPGLAAIWSAAEP